MGYGDNLREISESHNSESHNYDAWIKKELDCFFYNAKKDDGVSNNMLHYLNRLSSIADSLNIDIVPIIEKRGEEAYTDLFNTDMISVIKNNLNRKKEIINYGSWIDKGLIMATKYAKYGEVSKMIPILRSLKICSDDSDSNVLDKITKIENFGYENLVDKSLFNASLFAVDGNLNAMDSTLERVKECVRGVSVDVSETITAIERYASQRSHKVSA